VYIFIFLNVKVLCIYLFTWTWKSCVYIYLPVRDSLVCIFIYLYVIVSCIYLFTCTWLSCVYIFIYLYVKGAGELITTLGSHCLVLCVVECMQSQVLHLVVVLTERKIHIYTVYIIIYIYIQFVEICWKKQNTGSSKSFYLIFNFKTNEFKYFK